MWWIIKTLKYPHHPSDGNQTSPASKNCGFHTGGEILRFGARRSRRFSGRMRFGAQFILDTAVARTVKRAEARAPTASLTRNGLN